MDISRRLNDLPGQEQKGFSVILISKSCLGIIKTFPPETSKRVQTPLGQRYNTKIVVLNLGIIKVFCHNNALKIVKEYHFVLSENIVFWLLELGKY